MNSLYPKLTKTRLNKRTLIRALCDCLYLLREIENQRNIAGLQRGITEYRHNAEIALKVPHIDL